MTELDAAVERLEQAVRQDEQAGYVYLNATVKVADLRLALKQGREIEGVREGEHTEVSIRTHPESHPVLKAMIDVRHRAAGDFSPALTGQPFEDFDQGLLAAFYAAQAAILTELKLSQQAANQRSDGHG